MSKILVTGGAGYIGSHTCKALHAAGYTPVAYDDLSNGHRDAVKWGPFEQGDINDSAQLAAVFADHRPDAVVHFAGLIEVGRSVTDPAAFWHTNVEGSRSLLNVMREAGVDRIVFSSTAAVYGAPNKVPMTEDTPLAPVNPYGETKRMVETMLADDAATYGLRYAVLRYFNAAGADADGDIGERHEPETHLIPLVLQVALGQREEIAVFGSDYPTPDGTAIRDYVHVSDLATAHTAALAHLDGDTPDPVIANLGTGRGYSVREIIETCSNVTGHPIPQRNAPRRSGDPAELVADASRANRMLNWKPVQSDLETIVASAWRWHRANMQT